MVSLPTTSRPEVTVANGPGSKAVTIQDGGNSITVDGALTVSSGSVTVSGAVTVTSVVPGTAATNLGKAEDAAHASGDTGVMALGVRNDAGATTFGADQDYTPIATDANGRVGIADLGGSITVDTVAIVPGTGATNLGKAEDAAHASGDTGVAAWGVRNDGSATTFGANGDYTPIAVDATGRVGVTSLGGPALDVTGSAVTITSGNVTVRNIVADNPGIGNSLLYNSNAENDGVDKVGAYVLSTKSINGVDTFAITDNYFAPFICDDNLHLWVNAGSRQRSDTFAATGVGTTIDTVTGLKHFSIQVKGTGAAATAWTVPLQGSLDGTNFSTVVSHGTADLDGTVKAFATPFPCRYFRSNCTALTLGGASDIVVSILGMN